MGAAAEADDAEQHAEEYDPKLDEAEGRAGEQGDEADEEDAQEA